MNIPSETKTGTSSIAEEQTFIVLGVLIQFLSAPEQINDQISVMRGTVPEGVVIPLHSHADPEIFYVLNGSLEVFQAEGPSARAGKQRMPPTSFLSPQMSGMHSEILLIAR
jgi:quercetin dioxygenase-like cupin family protein